MRNLLTAHRGIANVCSREAPDLPLSAVAFDPAFDKLVCAFGPGDLPCIEIQQLFVSTGHLR